MGLHRGVGVCAADTVHRLAAHQFIGRLTPAASPEVQGAARAAIADAAKCVATSEDEQAVSMATAGPCKTDMNLSSMQV